MNIKSSVRFKAINKWSVQFFAAVLKAEQVLGLPITITSANDSTHKPHNGSTSFHYEDQAWDLRTRDKTTMQIGELVTFLKQELGYGWDVVLESDHIHVERDTRNYPDKP